MTHATKAAMSDYKASRFLACLSGCANGKILCDPLLFKNLNRILNAGACQYEAIRNMEKEYKSRRRFQTAAGGQKKTRRGKHNALPFLRHGQYQNPHERDERMDPKVMQCQTAIREIEI